MQVSNRLIEFLKAREGLRLTAYRDPGDPKGPWTVGYGHTGPEVVKGYTVTAKIAEDDLRKDIQWAEAAVLDCVKKPLTQSQFDALVSLTYNIGRTQFAGSTLVRKLNAGDVSGAAAEFDRWIHNDGKVVKGLILRRAAERKMFEEAVSAQTTPPPIFSDIELDVAPVTQPQVTPGSEMNHYEKIRASLDTGAVLLWRDDSFISRAIRFFSSGSNWRASFSHASLVVRGGDRVLTVEALVRGVQPTYLSERLGAYSGEVYALIPKVDEDHKKCIQIFAEEACCRNKGYDFDGLFSNIFSRVSTEASRFFCSEFVYQTLAACGVTSPRNDNLAPRPADLPEWLDLTPVRIK